jgi:alpha-tubulin suppressor-like RCC1 family protein
VAVSSNGCAFVVGLGDARSLGSDTDAGDVDAGVTIQASAIAVAQDHGCAVIQAAPDSPDNGTVRCWGANDAGALGVPPSSTPGPVVLPVAAGRIANVASLVAAAGSTCAVTLDGFLYCWGTGLGGLNSSGINLQGQSPAYEPAVVYFNDSMLRASSPSLGAGGGCVSMTVSVTPTLLCWGPELAVPARGDAGAVYYVYVSGTAASIGANHACAITSDGSDVECWGQNDHGQAGQPPGEQPSVRFPTPVGLAQPGESVITVSAGGNHSCALLSGGSVYCWGENDLGQLGNATVQGDTNAPTQVTALGDNSATGIAVGANHACALTSGESPAVQCWGDNTYGQLGIGTMPTGMPVQRQSATGSGYESLPNVGTLAAGGNTTCTIRLTDTRVWCWGANDSGQAGQPPSASVPYATPMNW